MFEINFISRDYGMCPCCIVRIIEFLIPPPYKVHPRDSVFLRRSSDEDELTLGRETRCIRVLVVHEHAVIQTPSCLGSLVNPRIAYIPSRFIAARSFFFLFPLRLALSRSFPFSLPGGPCHSPARVLGFSPLGGIAKVPTRRTRGTRHERKGTRELSRVKTLGYLVSRHGACPPRSIYLKLTGNRASRGPRAGFFRERSSSAPRDQQSRI